MILHTPSQQYEYAPHVTKIHDARGQRIVPQFPVSLSAFSCAPVFGNKNPAHKSPCPDFVYLVLGHACNHSCEYCMQRSFERRELSGDADAFLSKIRGNPSLLAETKTFLFWGGEALIYWEAITRIVTALKEERLINPQAKFLISTNGSLLDQDKVAFIKAHDIRVTLSHDGPGQGVRSRDPLHEDNPISRTALLDLAGQGNGNFILTPTLHTGNFSRFAILRHFASIFGENFDLPILSFGLFFLNGESLAYNPYLRNPIGAMAAMFLEYAHGVAERFFDFHTLLGRFSYSLAYQDYDICDTYESNFDVSHPKRIRINLAGELTAFHIGDFSPRYLMGDIDDMRSLRLPPGEFMGASEAVRIRCANCPVLPLCRGGEPYIQSQLASTDCLSKFVFYAPIWLYMLKVYFFEVPITGISGGDFRHKALLASFLASKEYRDAVSHWT